MFARIKQNLSKVTKMSNKNKVFLGVFVMMFFAGTFLLVDSVFAIGSAAGAVGTAIANPVLNFFSRALFLMSRLFMGWTMFFLEFFTELASYSDFMNAPPVFMGWLMIRDLANMFFIVALLVIAFGTILGLEQYEWKKAMVKLIFAAIFINFSKLILQLIIDAAHVFTVTFLNAISDTAGGNILRMLNMDEVLKMIAGPGASSTDGLQDEIFVAGLMALFLTSTAMFVVGAFFVMLVARLVVLWALMILSPLAFIAQVLPGTKKYATEFWQTFINYVIVAPVMVFFLWLSFATLGAGDIAAQIGINTSEASKAGSEAATMVGVPEEPTLSLSSASTWENLSNFAIAIAFLLIGISMVQRLGVVGASLTSRAVRYGTTITALVGGGYAARYVAKGALDAGKDYGKMALGKVRYTKPVDAAVSRLAKVPVLGGVTKEGKIKRKAAVKRLEDIGEERARKYAAEGPSGLAKILAIPKEKLAEEIEKTEAVVGRKKDEMSRFRSKAQQKIIKGDNADFYENKLNEISTKLKADLGVDISDVDFDGSLRKALDGAIKEGDMDKAEKAMNSIEKEIDGQYVARYKDEREKVQKGIQERISTGKITEEQGKEEMKALEEEQERTYGLNAKRELDRKAAKGTFMVSKLLEEKYAEEEAGSAEAARDTLKGMYNWVYLDKEKKKYKKEKARIDGEMESEKFAELSDDDKIDAYVDYAKTKKREQLRKQIIADYEKAWSGLTEKERETRISTEMEKKKDEIDNYEKEIRDAVENETDKTKKAEVARKKVMQETIEGDVKIEMLKERDAILKEVEADMPYASPEIRKKEVDKKIKEKVDDKVKEEETTSEISNKIQKAKAVSLISDQERNKRYEKEGLFKDLAIIGGEYETFKSRRRLKKAEGEIVGEQARVADVVRMQEGKTGDKLKEWEKMKVAEDLKDFDLPLEEMMKWLKSNTRQIKAINKEEDEIIEKNKGLPEGEKRKLSKEQENVRASLTQTQARLVSSYLTKYPGGITGMISDLDSSYKDIDVRSPEKAGKAIAGIVSGREWGKVESDENFSKVEQELRGRFKEKEDRIFRLLATGMDNAASKGMTTMYRQVSQGVDEYGNAKFGFTSNFAAGAGKGEKIGTGNATENGLEWRSGQEKGMLLPGFDRKTSDDGRAYVIEKSGVAYKFSSDEALQAVRSLASARKSEIENMSANKVYSMTGGSWGAPAFDGQNFKFASKEMQEGVALMMQDFGKNYNNALTKQAKQQVLDAWKEILRKINITKINDKDIVEASAKDVAEFVNEKVIKNESYKGKNYDRKAEEADKKIRTAGKGAEVPISIKEETSEGGKNKPKGGGGSKGNKPKGGRRKKGGNKPKGGGGSSGTKYDPYKQGGLVP